MEVVLAKTAGFCFGVRRAVETAFSIAGTGADAVTLGEIIHNPQVVDRLAAITQIRIIAVKPTQVISTRYPGARASSFFRLKGLTDCSLFFFHTMNLLRIPGHRL